MLKLKQQSLRYGKVYEIIKIISMHFLVPITKKTCFQNRLLHPVQMPSGWNKIGDRLFEQFIHVTLEQLQNVTKVKTRLSPKLPSDNNIQPVCVEK